MFNWAQFLTYVLVTAITPGPNNILSMTNAGRVGLRKALPFNLGILCGFSVVMLVCTLLCSLVSAALPAIKLPMLIVGAAYMLYLAWKTWKSPAEMEERQARNGFWPGLALQFVNPKIYIYGVVSMEAYVLPYYHGEPPALAGFALLLALVGFLCTVCWAAFGSVFKRLFTRHAKATNAVMALLLVLCAVSLFL